MSKKQKQEIVEYYMTVHYGVAAGPLDEIRAIIVNEKEAWSGSISTETAIAIDKADLFGGSKKEGGVQGTAHYLPGTASQTIIEYLANKLGLTAATCPGYRGLSSLWFYGPGTRGFYWSANQPYVPGAWVVARRSPKVLNPAIAMVLGYAGDTNDANPVHVIFEALTNTDWGVGSSTSGFDITAWNAAAQTLYDEKFGISILWTQPQTAEDFCANILTYIDGVMFINPRTGLMEIKLIRGDYDPDTLPVFDPDNAKMTNFQRKLWGETVNEIVVNWTNPASEESESVSIQDLANIAIQGAVVSDSNPYEGIRNKDLAMAVAARDLRVASSPLASCELEVNREAWDITPGSCIKVTWPKHGMVEVIMRVGNVDYGKIGDSTIRLALIEDVFSLDTQDYISPPSTGWTDPSEVPRALAYSLVFTLPYYMSRTMVDDVTLASVSQPEVVAGVLGGQTGGDTSQFTLAQSGVDTLGNTVIEYGSTLSIIGHGFIQAALPFAVQTTGVIINGLTQGSDLAAGCFAILGTTDADMEICLVKASSGTTVTLMRGIFDTTPKVWAAGTPIWILPPDAVIDDAQIREPGETAVYRPLPRTSKGMLAYSAATPISGLMTARPWAPSRPADVKVNSVASGVVSAIGASTLALTWKTRNRLNEDSLILDWDDAFVTPETGQTTSILVLNPADRAVLSRTDGITGNSYTLPIAAFAGNGTGIIRVIAVRDGFDSVQGHEITALVASGYGYGYGYNYGKSS